MFVYEPSANVHFLKLLFLIRPLFLILLLITDLVTLVWTQVLWQRTRCTLFAGFLITYDGVRCRHTLGGEVYHSNHFFFILFYFFHSMFERQSSQSRHLFWIKWNTLPHTCWGIKPTLWSSGSFWNISLVYKFVISYIYSLVCNRICLIPSQTNVRLGFWDNT